MWMEKYIVTSKPAVMFSNVHVASNVIFSLDDLMQAVQNKTQGYRLVPVPVMERALFELKKRTSLRYRFKTVA